MKKIQYQSIGIIHSPFTDTKGMPIQPIGAKGVAGTIELRAEYKEGLKDLQDFSHIILLYHFHASKGYSLKANPFMDDTPRGIFSIRAPGRPNPIGISIVRLDKIVGTTLYISDVDILNGTPLLDIKPYVPDFDVVQEKVRIGWLKDRSFRAHGKKSNGRFDE